MKKLFEWNFWKISLSKNIQTWAIWVLKKNFIKGPEKSKKIFQRGPNILTSSNKLSSKLKKNFCCIFLLFSRRFMTWNETTLMTLFFQSTQTDQNSSWKFYEILWSQIESFGLANWTKKVFRAFDTLFVGLIHWVFETFMSFCYFWASDMAPTYAVPHLFRLSVAFCLKSVWFLSSKVC